MLRSELDSMRVYRVFSHQELYESRNNRTHLNRYLYLHTLREAIECALGDRRMVRGVVVSRRVSVPSCHVSPDGTCFYQVSDPPYNIHVLWEWEREAARLPETEPDLVSPGQDYLYHATSPARAARIIEQGLLPGALLCDEDGAWWPAYLDYPPTRTTQGSLVWLATNPDYARMQGRYAVIGRGQTARQVVLAVTRGEYPLIKVDPWTYGCPQQIKPEHIRVLMVVPLPGIGGE